MSAEMILTGITSGLNIEAIKNARLFVNREFEVSDERSRNKSSNIPIEQMREMHQTAMERKIEYDRFTDEQLLDHLQNTFNDSQKLEEEYCGDFKKYAPKILEKYPKLVYLLSALVFDDSIAQNHNNWPHSLLQTIVAANGWI